MTRQEALKELENLTIDYGKRTAEEIERLDEAVDMAIAALREDAVDRPTCDDAVSRQQAIDALKGLPTWWADEGGYYGGAQPPMVALLDPEDAVSAIENLPAAQSHDIARDIATIIENEKDMRVILKNAQPDAPDTNGGDIIYRQAAIDALMVRDKELRNINWYDKPYAEGECRGIDEALAIVSNLPSAQPEPKPDKNGSEPFGNAEMLGDRTTDDCISRADVEQTVEDNILCYTHSDRPIDQDPDTECHKAIRMALRMLRKDLRKLPAVQPQPEECDTCKHGYFGDRWCDNCRVRYPSHYEREEHHGSD